jgi:drug/metabolite transporter (DMT)-like permease
MFSSISNTYLIGLGAGILAAIFFGAADFYVGIVAEKSSILASTAIAYILEFSVFGTFLFFQDEYGAAAENGKMLAVALAGNIGFLVFIYGLAKGRTSIVAPIAALLQLVIPLLLTVFIDQETLSMITWIGIIVSVIAVLFISIVKEDNASKIKKSVSISVLSGVIAGLCFSVFLTGISRVDTPISVRIFIAAVPAAILGAVYLASKRETIKPVMKYKNIILISSAGYMLAIWLFDYSENRVSLLISTLLIGLVPATTIILARLKKNEEITRLQYIGFAIALLGIVFLALGS